MLTWTISRSSCLQSLLLLCSFDAIIGLVVEISIEPKSFSVGKDLVVKCKISDESIKKSFKTFLGCPFIEEKDFCFSNCDSLAQCGKDPCDRQSIGGQSVECDGATTSSTLIYTYRFVSLSQLTLKYRKKLQFNCSYMGKTASQLVNVTASRPTIIIPKSSGLGSLKVRDVILMVVVGCLIVSFLINVWCAVRLCIKTSKKRKKPRKMSSESISNQFPVLNQPLPFLDINNTLVTIPRRASITNVDFGSQRMKSRTPIFEDNIINNKSQNIYLSSLYPSPVFLCHNPVYGSPTSENQSLLKNINPTMSESNLDGT